MIEQIAVLEPRKAIFDKVDQFERARQLAAAGFRPYFRAVEMKSGVRWVVDGRQCLVACSNDYLGLSCDRRVKEAARRALNAFGTSCTGSRLLNGTLALHERLERRLAEYLQVEAVLTFSAGFLGCIGVLSALGGRTDILYFDRENHASLYDGARLSFAALRKFRHNDLAQLEYLLASDADKPGGRLIVSDGVFSMSGEVARLPEIVELAKTYGAAVVLDDAHATGVLGPGGRGTAASFGLEAEVDVILGTFSKTFGSQGGFVTGSREVIDFVKHVARPFMFTAALPGMQIAATLKALEIIERENWRREKIWQHVSFYREGMRELGFDTLGSKSPIVPILVGEDKAAFRFWQKLWDDGIYASVAVPPGVRNGQCIIRTSITAEHSHEDLVEILNAFERAGRAQGLI